MKLTPAGKRLFLAFLAFLVAISITSCSKTVPQNENTISAYEAGMFSDAKFFSINQYATIDQNESFYIGLDSNGKVFGNLQDVSKVNWGLSQSITPKACENESFWNSSTKNLVNNPKLTGFLTKFSAIELTASNFRLSNASLFGQYTIVFKDEALAKEFFKLIKESIALCAANVKGLDLDGNEFDTKLSNAPSKNFEYFKISNDAVMRQASDGLIALDVFVKTKYSISLFKIFLNDLNLPKRANWNIFDSLIQEPINNICEIEECVSPVIDIAGSQQYSP